MKDFIIEYLTSISPNIVIITIIFIIFMLWIIFKNRTYISDFFNEIYNKRQRQEELLQTIKANQTNIKTIIEDRINDRNQISFIQKELSDVQIKLSNSLADISNKIDHMQKSTDERFEESEKKNKKRIRAELKDKISQSYRYYHSIGKINDMELEALEDLIEEYEAADGKNSFVHSVVQKEMYIWERV